MAIDVYLKGESGNVLASAGDTTNVLARTLPARDDESFAYVRFIDRWGNTIFNRGQMEHFLDEWRRIANHATTEEERGFFADVEHLAKRCAREVHLYLWFVGD